MEAGKGQYSGSEDFPDLSRIRQDDKSPGIPVSFAGLDENPSSGMMGLQCTSKSLSPVAN